MTTWQSMFDAGACVVKVYANGAFVAGGTTNTKSLLWEGVLAPGQASPVVTDTTGTYQVSVDSAGLLTLVAISGDPDLFGHGVEVWPQYSVSSLWTSAQQITAAKGAQLPLSYNGVITDGVSTVAIDLSALIGSPSEADFDANGAYVGAWIPSVLP